MKYFVYVLLVLLVISAAKASRLDGLDELGLSFGEGEQKLYVFASPTCPYCRKFDQTLRPELVKNGFKVVYLIIAPGKTDSDRNMATSFYCSDNKPSAINGFRFTPPSSEPPEIAERCNKIVEDMNTLASYYKIRGTPSIILPDESIIAGIPKINDLLVKYINALSAEK